MSLLSILKKRLLVLAILAGISLALVLLLSLSLGLAPRAVLAQVDLPTAWTAAEPVPHITSNYAFAQCVDDPDGFYVIGGAQAASDPIDYTWHYDAGGDTWTGLEPLPVAMFGSVATCYEGKIYAAGGGGSTEPMVTHNMFIYDIASDTWTQGTDLPHRQMFSAIGAWDGKLYLVGGTTIDYPWPPLNHIDIYDIATGVWTNQGGDPMPVAACLHGYSQVGSYLYIAGGWSGDPNSNLIATQRYDMAADTWEIGPIFPGARDDFGLAATGTHLYAMGGDANFGDGFDAVESVDFLDYSVWPGSSWNDLNDPLPDNYAGNVGSFCTEAVTGGEIWSVGGFTLETITNTNYYRHAEPCADFYFGNLAPESLDDSGAPGEVVAYTLTITNNGTLADTYDIASSASWTTAHPATVGPLDPGESAELTVQVTIPLLITPGEQDLATITATSQGDPSQSDQALLTTNAEVTHGVSCNADCTAHSGFSGTVVSYTLTVTNEGNTTDTFDLETGGNIWTTDLSQTQVTLGVGESTQVVVSVTIPEGALAGAVDTVAVTLTSEGDPATTDTVSLTTTALATLKVYVPWVEKN